MASISINGYKVGIVEVTVNDIKKLEQAGFTVEII
jgi:hypothetical protein